jgi:glutamate/tyrosine decarboxylase-like PLP-dependent enzyme
VLHRPKANVRYQYYQFADWPGGAYATQGFLGTKPAAPIAAAWAVMHYLGEEGYVRLARASMAAAKKLQDGIAAIDGLHVWGEPDMSVIAVGSDRYDIGAIGDVLTQRGWHFDRQDGPPSLHLMASARHDLVVDEFLVDLRDAVEHNAGTSDTAATYGDVITPEMKS